MARINGKNFVKFYKAICISIVCFSKILKETRTKKIQKRTQIINVFLILFFIISFSSPAALPQQDLEWKAKIGDSKTYVIEKWFDDNDLDGDGDKNTETALVTDENDETVEV
ncbi:MAG: hypothetical protein ACFE9L_09905, partial [Candidatus Hodarchaeota archaeon]